MSKKFFVIIALTALCICVVSCAPDKNTDNRGSTESNNGGNMAQNTGNGRFVSDAPVTDMKGYNFKFMNIADIGWGMHIMDAEEQTGEPISDAFYLRNRYIESLYNCTISEEGFEWSSIANKLKTNARANDFTYDAYMVFLHAAGPLAQEGILCNFHNIPNIDLSKPWWDQNIVRDLTICGSLFFATGDINMFANDATWILYFNKRLQAESGVENLYDLVASGKWTFDKFLGIIKNQTKDLDGNGVINYGDQVGFVTHQPSAGAFFQAAGESVFVRQGDDIVINISKPRFSMVYDKIMEIMNYEATMNTTNTKRWKFTGIKQDPIDDTFTEGKAMFCGEVTDCIARFRYMEDSFGILPFPKFDESQEGYNNLVIGEGCLALCVPQGYPEPDSLGAVLDALAAESRNRILPAYYEMSLKRKHTRDEESAAMLDLIFSNRSYTFDAIFDWGKLGTKIFESITNDNNSLASIYEKSFAATEKDIDKALEKYAALK